MLSITYPIRSNILCVPLFFSLPPLHSLQHIGPGAQIAEAWAKRRYERHFVSKLTD